MENILLRLQDVYRNVLDTEDIVLRVETVADDIEEWDSLTHVLLVVAIEKEFSVKFTSNEIMSWRNVGEIVNSIKAKL